MTAATGDPSPWPAADICISTLPYELLARVIFHARARVIIARCASGESGVIHAAILAGARCGGGGLLVIRVPITRSVLRRGCSISTAELLEVLSSQVCPKARPRREPPHRDCGDWRSVTVACGRYPHLDATL